ncbi:MAG TPA: hypothetical protein VFP45_03370 [Candidatus Nitrosotalea sp.]|nr:hypothetical protein [Candidatus Nitrosotalea sp.]
MSSRGRKEAPVGKGIDARTMQVLRARGAPSITVHEINENAWKAFYASPEGKARLRRMQDLNNLKRQRYEAIARGTRYVSGTSQTDADVQKTWKRTVFDQNGNVRSRGFGGEVEQGRAATAFQNVFRARAAERELQAIRAAQIAEEQAQEQIFQAERAATAQGQVPQIPMQLG